MKISHLTLVATSLIILGAIFTNPKEDMHYEMIKSRLNNFTKKIILEKFKIDKYDIDKPKDSAGLMFVKVATNIDFGKYIKINNYGLFSTSNINFRGKSKSIGLGFFGNIYFLLNSDYSSLRDDILIAMEPCISTNEKNGAGIANQVNSQDNERIRSEIDIDVNKNESENKLPRQNSTWVGKYNNYDSSLPNYMGFSYCNPGKVDIEIKKINNDYRLVVTYEIERMDVHLKITRVCEVSESNENYIIFNEVSKETNMTFVHKIYKVGSRYFVKNITQKDCDDYGIVRNSL